MADRRGSSRESRAKRNIIRSLGWLPRSTQMVNPSSTVCCRFDFYFLFKFFVSSWLGWAVFKSLCRCWIHFAIYLWQLIYCTLLSKVKTWTVSIYTPGTVPTAIGNFYPLQCNNSTGEKYARPSSPGDELFWLALLAHFNVVSNFSFAFFCVEFITVFWCCRPFLSSCQVRHNLPPWRWCISPSYLDRRYLRRGL